MSPGSRWRRGVALGVCTCLMVVDARGQASDAAADWQGLRLLMSEAERRFSEVRWLAVGPGDAQHLPVPPLPAAQPAPGAPGRPAESVPGRSARRAPAARATLCSDRGSQSILGTRLGGDDSGFAACQ